MFPFVYMLHILTRIYCDIKNFVPVLTVLRLLFITNNLLYDLLICSLFKYLCSVPCYASLRITPLSKLFSSFFTKSSYFSNALEGY